MQLLPLIVIFVILFTIWLLRKRILNYIPHAYVFVLILQLAQIVLGTPMAIAVMSPEMQELNVEAKLRSQLGECFRTTAFIIVLGTPSLSFLIAYLSIYVMAIVCLTLLKGDLNDPIFIEALKIQPGNIAAMTLIFAILQERELRRFLD